jgi:cytochrome c
MLTSLLRVPLSTTLILCTLAIGLGACSRPAARAALEPPEENRFTRRVLVDGLDEPMQMDFDRQGRVYIIERGGALKRYDEATGQLTLLGTVPVLTEVECGLLGILLDEQFETTRHLYLHYQASGEAHESRLSRFTLGADDRLDPASEIVMLRWPHDLANHMGGGMTWGPPGTGELYLSTGDNTRPSQFARLHWTSAEGEPQVEDAQRTSGSANDLRGKILRIRPQPDGSYTIPEGNLFPPGTPGTRPEIYVMGGRNPWRLSVDSQTGYLFWGDIGPDSGQDSVRIGPRGYDEFNVTRAAGNFGWPFFIGYNRAYNSYDPATETYGAPFDVERPINTSPNNTGLPELPPAQPALIAYPYGVSEEYPLLGSGGRAAVGGPLFRRADFRDAERPFPEFYDGKWFIVDYMRSWIMVVAMDRANTEVVSIDRFLPREELVSPLDMAFGPRGDLYVIEYGRGTEGRLSRIEFNAGNRPPWVQASVDRAAGATPLRIALSSEGTVDHDGDRLRYEWVVTRREGGEPLRFTEPNPTVTLTEPGVYHAVLTATDPAGASGTGEVEIVAGNEPPVLTLELTRGNRSFYFDGETVTYRVTVSDQEDGSLADGGIAAEDVHVTVEYVPFAVRPVDLEEVSSLEPGAPVGHMRAVALLAQHACAACHAVEAVSIGPSFRQVAQRYRGRADAVDYLSQKIIGGGSGVWGAMPMPPHPAISAAEGATLARYVLSLAETDAAPRRLPVQGSLTTRVHTQAQQRQWTAEHGSYVLRATYTDRGASGVAPITASRAVLLRYPHLLPETAEIISDGITYSSAGGDPMFIVSESGAHIGFRNLDLTGIDRIEIGALTRFWAWSHFVGGSVEVRLGSPTGQMVGGPIRITPPATAPPSGVFFGDDLDPPVQVDVSAVTGMHDVYIVFRNPDAGAGDALVILTHIGFERAR